MAKQDGSLLLKTKPFLCLKLSNVCKPNTAFSCGHADRLIVSHYSNRLAHLDMHNRCVMGEICTPSWQVLCCVSHPLMLCISWLAVKREDVGGCFVMWNGALVELCLCRQSQRCLAELLVFPTFFWISLKQLLHCGLCGLRHVFFSLVQFIYSMFRN